MDSWRKTLKIFWHSDGCKVNLADLESMLQGLPPGAWQVCDRLEEADVALLNTCTVTHKADADWRKMLSGWRRRRPTLPVVVSGCATVFQAERIATFPNVRAVVRPGDGQALREFLCSMLAGSAEPVLGSVSHGLGRHRALVKIQDGCQSRCSYCLVSLVRGEERSLDEEQVVEAVRCKLQAGYREVVLCGINLGRYGRDRRSSLARVLIELKKLQQAYGHWRLRLSSIEPMEWSAQLIEAIGECDFVCRHFHVPVQSGDDGVLGLMRRPYRALQARKVLEELRAAFPQAALGSDLLVGFPGEDRAAFENTLDFARLSPLDYLHVFAFSPRPGTEAEKLSGRVPAAEVRGRVAELRALGGEKWRRFLLAGVGMRHLVLAEKCQYGKAEGRSEHYRRVVFRGERLEAGAMYEVYGEKVAGDTLLGRAIDGRCR